MMLVVTLDTKSIVVNIELHASGESSIDFFNAIFATYPVVNGNHAIANAEIHKPINIVICWNPFLVCECMTPYPKNNAALATA